MSEMAPGWYPDPQWPAAERFWDGRQWTAQTRVPTKPATAGKIALGVAGGICAVLLGLFVLNEVTGPSSELECSTQRLDAQRQGQPLPDC